MAARQKLALIGSGFCKKKGGANLPSKKKTFSWIWTEGGGAGGRMTRRSTTNITAVRVKWLKVLSRKKHWEEEVQVLQEEMRHILRFLRWLTLWWEGRQQARTTDISREMNAGLDTYTARQATLTRQIARASNLNGTSQ
ncbi:hypothetical protein C8J57DRAFT_1096179 [Mycena rebaudengoi]|nr:hypothetical protein C8J57DRAFT_1096179 [Mycena rebaudengoi]